MSVKILALESYTLKPHLETAGEILLQQMAIGERNLGFCYIGDWGGWSEEGKERTLNKYLGGKSARVGKMEKILKERGVNILCSPSIAGVDAASIKEWASNAPKDLAGLKEYAYKNALLGLGVASSFISKFRDPNLSISECRRDVILALMAAAFVYEKALRVIEEYRPEIVLTFNGRFACCYPIVKAAESLGVRVLRHERGANYKKYNIYTGSVHSMALLRQRILDLWSEKKDVALAEKIGREFFVRRRSGDGLGWVSFTENQVENLVPEKTGKRRVVYFSSSDDEWAAVEDGAHHKFEPAGQKRALERLIAICGLHSEHLELIVRVHPNAARVSENEARWWSSLSEYKHVNLILPQSPVDSYALAESGDVICVFGSTMGVESAFWGRPTILLSDSGYSGFGCCFEPKSDEELESMLLNPPAHWPLEGCLKYGYYYMTFGEDYKFYNPSGLFDGTFCFDPMTPRYYLADKTIGIVRNVYKAFRGLYGK